MRFSIFFFALALFAGVAQATNFWAIQSQTGIVNSSSYLEVDEPVVLFNGSTYYAWFSAENSTGWEFRFTNSTNKQGFDLGMSTNIGNNSTHVMVFDPTVVLDGSTFHAWFVAENGSEGNEIFYAASTADDANFGAVWSAPRRTNVFNNSSEISVSGPTVILDAGTWKMWYQAENTTDTMIKYATSADGLTWTQGGIALTNNSSELWIGDPFVFRDTYQNYQSYKMFYNEIDANDNISIIYANSTDGVAWTRQAWTNISSTSERLDVSSPSVLRNASSLEIWFYEEQFGLNINNFAVRFANQSNALRAVSSLDTNRINLGGGIRLTINVSNIGTFVVSSLNASVVNISTGGVNSNASFVIAPANFEINNLAVGASASFNWTITAGGAAGAGDYVIEVKFRAVGGNGEVIVVNDSIGFTITAPGGG
ncbi:hypothetical protein HYS54_04310, partial [Candidatus Micrarchaeota archaeon]|nr:hypothetical protein [Candidatus Micrarchaeota archaeon]